MSNKVFICGIDTSQLPRITNAEMLELLIETKKGNQEKRDLCIINNMRLVLSIVQRFSLRQDSVDDVFQVGVVGLIKAIDNFDTSLGVQFSTYAVPMIIGEIRRFQRDRTSIKVTRTLRDIAYKALQAKEAIEKNQDDEASIAQIANLIDTPIHAVSDAIKAISEPVSIYETIYSDGGNNLKLLDQIKDSKNNEESWIENNMLSESLEKLSSREKEILRLRYFVGKTQTEISNEIGISQAQVSRLEKDALSHMRKFM